MRDIEQILRDDAHRGIPDDGFTQRTLRALPPRMPLRSRYLEPALVIGSGALGSVLAVVLAPTASIVQGFADVLQLRGFTPAAVTALAMGGALLVSAVVLAVESD